MSNNIVHESLPGYCIDLDNCTVETLDSAMEQTDFDPSFCIVDDVIDSGVTGLYHDNIGETQWIHWGKTRRYENGQYNVVIDAHMITLDILQVLWLMGVIDGDLPTTATV